MRASEASACYNHVMSRHQMWLAIALAVNAAPLAAQQITTAGAPAQLEIRQAGPHSIRVTLKPLSYTGGLPFSPGVAERTYSDAVVRLTTLAAPVTRTVGTLSVEIRPS